MARWLRGRRAGANPARVGLLTIQRTLARGPRAGLVTGLRPMRVVAAGAGRG